MDQQAFWTVTPDSGHSMLFHERIDSAVDRLSALSDEAIVAFEHRLRALQGQAYRSNLWAAGYLATGGMGEDSFLDFRTWLILQGRSTYEAVLVDPDALVDLSWDEEEEISPSRSNSSTFPRGSGRNDTELTCRCPPTSPGSCRSLRVNRSPKDDDEWFRAHLPRLSAMHLPG